MSNVNVLLHLAVPLTFSRSNSVDDGSPMNGLPFRQHFAKTSPDSPVPVEKGAPLHEEIARKFAGVHWQFMNGMKYEKQEVR